MKKEKEVELKEKNRKFREILKEIIAEKKDKDSELKNRLLKRVLKNEKCNIISYNSKLNIDFKHKCDDNFCQLCLKRKRNKRYKKVMKSFEISREKIEKDYVESFITLNVDYNKINEKDIDKVTKIYKEEILNKFLRKAKKLNTLGYICNIELPYVPTNSNSNSNNWQIHSHLVICIKRKQLTQLQKIFKEVCLGAGTKGNLHFGGKKKIKTFYASENNNRRSKDFNESRIANYLSKSYLQYRTKVQNEIKNQVVEKLERKEEIKQLIQVTENKLKSFQNLKFFGIYDINKEKREKEKERKEEKSRIFLVKEYENKNIKNAEIFENKEEKVLVLRFKSNNKTVDKIEKETKGKAEAKKGRNAFKNLLEEYNLKEIEAEAEVKAEVNNNIITSAWKKEETVFIEKEVDFEKLEMLNVIMKQSKLIKENEVEIRTKNEEIRVKNEEIKAITKSYFNLFNKFMKSEAEKEKLEKVEKENEELIFKNQILKARNEEINSKYNDLITEYFRRE